MANNLDDDLLFGSSPAGALNKVNRRDVLKKLGVTAGGLSLLGLEHFRYAMADTTGGASPIEHATTEIPLPEAAPSVEAKPGPKRPNIVVFFTDQQRWDVTGASGNHLGLTPNFDRMAARGAYLENYFTCQPLCGPARSCLQTGLFATQIGCWKNGIILDTNYKDTLARKFNQAGYNTGYIGKWHLGSSGQRGTPVEQRGGFDYWLASNELEFTSDAYQVTVFDSKEHAVHLPGYRSDALTDAAVRYISDQAASDKPFLLFVSYIEPHQQNSRDDYPAPDVYKDTYRDQWKPPDLANLSSVAPKDPDCADRCLPGYLGMIKRLDECLGRVLDTLKSLNMDDDTIVIYTADHGNHFKTRNSEYKRSCHESSIRIPGAIQGPGFDGAGPIKELVSLIDLPPTMLAAAGLDVPPKMMGRAVGDLVKGTITDWNDDVFVQISETQTGRAVRTARWKYCIDSSSHVTNEAHSEQYVEQYLYDLEADPYELTNLAGQPTHVDVAAEMQERLKKWMKLAGEPDAVITRA